MDNMRHYRTQTVTAVSLVAMGSGLLIAGFILAPAGQIHNSVLVAFGEALTFAGSVFGVTVGSRIRNRTKD